MNIRRIALLAAACALTAGCRQDPYLNTHIEMMNAERRSLEDRIYELEHEKELQAEELDKLKSGAARPRRQEGAGAPDRTSGESELAPPQIELPGVGPASAEEEDFRNLKPPVIEPGIPVDPIPESATGSMYPATASTATGSATGPESSASARSGSRSLPPGDPRITQLHIQREMTGGRDWDQRPGDDGISLVIEPRNGDGLYVPLAGPVAVVVLDPAEQGELQRVARWDLDALEVHGRVRDSGSERGIHLDLPWPEKTPRHSQLHLFVRYVTVDGRPIEADQPISINLPGPRTGRWTPRSAPRGTDDGSAAPLPVARPVWSPFR